jgi:hypothetical protein
VKIYAKILNISKIYFKRRKLMPPLAKIPLPSLHLLKKNKTFDDCQEPLEVELHACVEGLVLALQHSQLPIIVESDCSQLVYAARSSSLDRYPFYNLINKISSKCDFVKGERGHVRVSDSLARLARVQLFSMTWLGSGPEDVLHLLELDCSLTLPV